MAKINHKSILKSGPYSGFGISGLDHEIVLDLYKFMVRLRRCEEALINEYHRADEMRCPVHFSIGQEAVSAGLSVLLTRADYLFSHHRTHGYFLAKGGTMRSLFAELYGRETGANGGKAGSQDISITSMHFHSGAIVSGALAISVGTALGFQLNGEGNIAVAGFGEAAADEGIFWEAINYACLRKLPVVFICENNLYSTYSHQLKRQVADNISDRVAAFGARTKALFGNDVIRVYNAIAEAVNYARAGTGPYFIEAYTYRWNGHVGPEGDDDVGYRPNSELEFWKANCPISLLENRMLESGLLSPRSKASIIDEIEGEIADAFKFAKSSPPPSVTEWESLNYSTASPLAEKLLCDARPFEFDPTQAFTTPKPY